MVTINIVENKVETEIDSIREEIKLVFDESKEIKDSFFDCFHSELMENTKYKRYVHLCFRFRALKKREAELLNRKGLGE